MDNNYNPNAVQVIPAQNAAPVVRNVFADDGFDISLDMTTAKTSFCSMVPASDAEKAAMYNAMNNPDERLSECINKVIEAKDLFIEVVNCTNTETGEVTACPRIVIIDKNGKSYQCVSIGIYSALKKVIQIYGAPTWEKPVKMEVKQITKGARKMLTLNVVA